MVEGGGLENRKARKGLGGSNPSSSAIFPGAALTPCWTSSATGHSATGLEANPRRQPRRSLAEILFRLSS